MRLAQDAIAAFATDLLAAHGVTPDQAASVARIMAWCEAAGRSNFGLQRIPVHLERLEKRVLNGAPVLSFREVSPSMVSLDGDNGFGHYIAERGMARAIEKAGETGIGCVGARRSNFFGAGSYFVKMAADAGMIGLAMSNSFPKVAAHNGLLPVLGTNPFAFGAPARDGRHLLFDMATSALAGSTVRQSIEAGAVLPEGLAIDADGKPITDPRKVDEGALLPFGGAKGFGLSLMVEILAGVLTGAGVADGVASMYKEFGRDGGNGHLLIAIDISKWMPIEAFHQRLDMLLGLVKSSNPVDEVLFPGEVRWRNLAESEKNGIEIDAAVWTALKPYCAAAGVPMPA
jgi:ureidoglycolate dehydrogenase (NAD+)